MAHVLSKLMKVNETETLNKKPFCYFLVLDILKFLDAEGQSRVALAGRKTLRVVKRNFLN